MFREDTVQYPVNELRTVSSQEYMNHLERLSEIYLRENKKQYVNVKRYNKYFKRVKQRIYINNENVLLQTEKINVYIIRDNAPFYFSMPGMNIFLSKGLIVKYMKNEDMFISLLSREILKSNLGIYKKAKVVPFDKISIQDLVKLSRLDLKTTRKLNNLNYSILKRSGYDPESMLFWLQMQNRNSIDFSKQYESPNEISKEEFYLKNFLVTQQKADDIAFEKNSSPEFYRFRKYVERAL